MAEEADSRTVQVSRSQLIRSGIFTSTDLASDCYQAIKLYAKKPSSIFYGQIAVMFAPGILFLIFGSSLGGLGPSTALIFGTLKYHTKIIFQKMILLITGLALCYPLTPTLLTIMGCCMLNYCQSSLGQDNLEIFTTGMTVESGFESPLQLTYQVNMIMYNKGKLLY